MLLGTPYPPRTMPARLAHRSTLTHSPPGLVKKIFCCESYTPSCRPPCASNTLTRPFLPRRPQSPAGLRMYLVSFWNQAGRGRLVFSLDLLDLRPRLPAPKLGCIGVYTFPWCV